MNRLKDMFKSMLGVIKSIPGKMKSIPGKIKNIPGNIKSIPGRLKMAKKLIWLRLLPVLMLLSAVVLWIRRLRKGSGRD